MIENIRWILSTPGGRKLTSQLVAVITTFFAVSLGSTLRKNSDLLTWGETSFFLVIGVALIVLFSLMLLNGVAKQLDRHDSTRKEFEDMAPKEQFDLLWSCFPKIF